MTNRLLKEQKIIISAIVADPSIGIGAQPKTDDDLRKWRAILIGPAGTPYEGGWFSLTIVLPKEYPHKPPRVTFDHQVFHPNVYTNNHICVDILSSKWTPIYTICKILTSIRSLLNDPNVNSPANTEASRAFQKYKKGGKGKTQYVDKVRRTMVAAGRYETPLPQWYNELYCAALFSVTATDDGATSSATTASSAVEKKRKCI